MNTKAIIASTMLTAVLTATSATASDNDYFETAFDTSKAQPYVIKHALLLTINVAVEKQDDDSVNR